MGEKLRQPVSGGKVANVPVILQLEALECGAACLSMILAYYGKWISLEQVRKDCGVSRDGSSAKNILYAARNYGMEAKGYRYEPDALREAGSFPCIIHWNFNHFTVLDGFKGNHAVLNDPARGRIEVTKEEFDESFTGICIMMSPTERFQKEGRKKGTLDFFRGEMSQTKKAFLFFTIVTVAAATINIINPVFSRVFLDHLLTGENPGLVNGFILILAAFSLVQVVISIINSYYSVKIEGKLAVSANARYMWHVLRLPVDFFSQRMVGDVAMRKQNSETIASEFVETAAPLILDVFMVILYVFIMLRYSWILTLIGLGGIALNLLTVRFISDKRMNLSRVMMRDEAKLQGTAISAIDMMETIKASGAEDGIFAKWAGYQASVNRQNGELTKLNSLYLVISTFLSQTVDALILALGILFTIRGQFSIGLILAFQTLLTTLQEPVNGMITAQDTIRTMRVNTERIDDVMKYRTDVNYSGENQDAVYDKLKGKVELKHVTFGYSPLAPALIEDFSMTVEPGKRVAFIGSSGCGKSTLARLISGLYQPWSGEILFDGKPLGEIDRNVFTGSLAVVNQDITLFEDTIGNNIRMWDHSIEDFEVILAARDASIHEDIMQRDGGYNYKMLEGGKDFSGGQRQRIEIARVLAQDPTIIIMDEATSALDAQTEYDVVKAVHDRGITCIVIAHRLSTIRDCDEIIVMDKGKILERGTHNELMQKHGAYEELITSE
ncbi:MAG: NHLP family bacteriocin export ABC transporter peptidase/permease/ATPase subunit [Lachnospiraceae bacterium]|jgi:NHLM bacteriocin system ABC transporter peptidase/ATP-binding protein|nr:NHLP family bacteriocin export ABC transporter peptidase/permease/ATPase subunit [Lachnospiraceae bacterium]